MRDSIEIPEEIEFTESFRKGNDLNEGPPIDDDIDEDLPITESQEWKKRRDKHNPSLSKVVDETIIEENEQAIPDVEEFKNLKKLIMGPEVPTTSSSVKKNKFSISSKSSKASVSKYSAPTGKNSPPISQKSNQKLRKNSKISNPTNKPKNASQKPLGLTPSGSSSKHKTNKSFSYSNYPKTQDIKALKRPIQKTEFKSPKKDEVTVKILQKLYRIHSRFRLVIDETIDVSRPIYDTDDSKGKQIFDFGEKPELEEYEARVEKFMQLNSETYKEKQQLIKACFQIDESHEEEDKGEDEEQSAGIMHVSLLNLKKHHSLFLNLSTDMCNEMILQMPLLVLKDSELLYKEGEPINAAYIVVMGKVIMHSKKLGAIGLVKVGDVIGEECLVHNSKIKTRLENAYSSGETYVLECIPDFWDKLKNILLNLNQRSDFAKLARVVELCFVKKKSWRQYRKKKMKEL
ncbi:unnamed protein product [Moneuplotes crassus]|uniref:Cyclic nucleotide-binding domain-containing protein n=1 Tax=Euplotes crassus TaxID=5936 RepID=A0AAD1UG01_EUPCR|nr:unnamed protein product [Moneuplotes crassus]